uniref:Alpha N-terminal protein methyltransferase 1 n=1 Tax=Tanacetum cinerariifolium TaxID=118510 RepID=A0A6L2K6N3_TANCI|nr:hypothetical protein [Tanacetum cinerariifolium]
MFNFLARIRLLLLANTATNCGFGIGRVTKNLLILQREFTLDAGRHDVIWIQWYVGQLDDDDFVSFFKKAKAGPKPGGLFVLKENLVRSLLASRARGKIPEVESNEPNTAKFLHLKGRQENARG